MVWAREIAGERLGTAMEPVIAGATLFVATHAGNLYALDAETGKALRRFQAHGAFLQSPAVAHGVVIVGCTDGNLYGVSAEDGRLLWQVAAGAGGCSAAPVIEGSLALICELRSTGVKSLVSARPFSSSKLLPDKANSSRANSVVTIPWSFRLFSREGSAGSTI